MNEPNYFDIMAYKSNKLIISALSKYIIMGNYIVENDKYSPNDLLIKLPNGNNLMIEGKVRNADYLSLMMNYSKIVNLRKKELYYANNNITINDILYVNVYEDNLYVFSLNELRKNAKNKNVTCLKKISSQIETDNFFEETNSKYLVTEMMAKANTAIDGNSNYVQKTVVLFNKYFSIPNQTLQNYEFV